MAKMCEFCSGYSLWTWDLPFATKKTCFVSSQNARGYPARQSNQCLLPIQLEPSSFWFSCISECVWKKSPWASKMTLGSPRKTGTGRQEMWLFPWGSVTLSGGRFYRRAHMFTQSSHICPEPLWTAVAPRGQDRSGKSFGREKMCHFWWKLKTHVAVSVALQLFGIQEEGSWQWTVKISPLFS